MKHERVRHHHVAGLFAVCERARFKSTPQIPTPASPTAVSGAQTQSNVDTAEANAALGNVNQISPFGSTTFNQTGSTNVDGRNIPQFTQTTSLDPTLQGIVSGTQKTAASLIPTGQALANQAATSTTTPLNFSGANNSIIQGGPQAVDNQAATAAYNSQAGFLQPTYQLQQEDLQDQLSRQGIGVGSDAYNSAQTNLANSQNQGYTSLANSAVNQGINAGSNMFNLAVMGQNQQIGQQQIGQSNPLSLLSQLYSSSGAGGVA
jgi:hypothetical protein